MHDTLSRVEFEVSKQAAAGSRGAQAGGGGSVGGGGGRQAVPNPGADDAPRLRGGLGEGFRFIVSEGGLLLPELTKEVPGAGFEGEGIKAAAPVDQRHAGGPGKVPVLKQPGAGGARLALVGFAQLAGHAFFFEEFEGGKKEVMEVAPDGVKFDQEGRQGGIVQTVLTKEFTDVGAVFLFDVGVVVFVIGTGAGDVDGRDAVTPEGEQMPVEELGAVVAVHTQERERKAVFHGFKGGGGGVLAFVPGGLLLGPARADVCQHSGPPEARTGSRRSGPRCRSRSS